MRSKNSRIGIDGSDRIPGEIGCLDIKRLPATLISDAGNHCQVWRQGGTFVKDGHRMDSDLVIKIFREPCMFGELKLYTKEYRRLRETLGPMVPDTVFAATLIDGKESVVAISHTVSAWFNIANPHNESEAIPLLRMLHSTREELRTFVEAAHRWRDTDDPKVIDLYGVDNLVLDRSYRLKYMDSFGVFFHESLLYLLAEVDYDLKSKIDLSLWRLSYLEHLLEEADKPKPVV